MKKQQLTQLIVVASSATAIAFFGFKFYQTYKELKEQEKVDADFEMRAEAARLIMKRDKKQEELVKELVEDVTETAEIEDLEHLEARDLDYDDEDEESDIWDDRLEEEEETLRFPPDSADALTQYREMRLAEFDNILGAKRTLWMLFNHPFRPSNKRDQTIFDQIVEERRDFFRTGRHVEKATLAELILHFGRLLDFDLDGGIEYWTDILLDNIGVTPGVGTATMEQIAESICNHTFVGKDGAYGIFGLDTEQYQRMLRTSEIGPITFLRQYHVYTADVIQEKGGLIDG